MTPKTRDLIGFTLTSIIVIIYLVVGFTYLWNADQKDQRSIKYDCSISEISPDFPLEVKEQCRKLRSGRI